MLYVRCWGRNVAPRSRVYKTFYLFTPVALRPNMGMASLVRFLYHAQWRATVVRTPLDTWSARDRDLYLTTHNTHKRHIHSPGGIRTHNPSKREATHPRLRLRGQHYRQDVLLLVWIGNLMTLCMTYTIAVCTVKNSWRCTEELSETCSYMPRINLRN